MTMTQRLEARGPVAVRTVISRLAPTLGWERSQEVVLATARKLRCDEGALSPEDVTAILEDLALEEGIVGVTARFALSRGGGPSGRMAAVTTTTSIPPPSDSAPASAVLVATIGVHEVAAQLTPLLGADKTEAALHASMRRLGLPRERLDREQAIRLLDDLGHQDGVVGMTVRFVRGRVLARFSG
jgi:hypothetical protein